MTEAPVMIPFGLDEHSPEVVWALGVEVVSEKRPTKRLCAWLTEDDAIEVRRQCLNGGMKATHPAVYSITIPDAMEYARAKDCEWLAVCTFTPPTTFTIVRMVAV